MSLVIEGLRLVVEDRKRKMCSSVQCHLPIGMDLAVSAIAINMLKHASNIVVAVNEYKDAEKELGEAIDAEARRGA